MKKLLFATLILATLAGIATAQKVGGYKTIATGDPAVQKAAAFAVQAQGKASDRTITLISVKKAEAQTVAGRNYRMCLKVESTGGEDEADAIFFAQAVVYVDLKGNSKLTAWEPTECAEDDGDD